MSNPLTALFSFLSNLFHRPARLPHPEEKMNPKLIFELDQSKVFNKWLNDWGVPLKYQTEWFKKVYVLVYNEWPEIYLTSSYVNTNIPAFTFQVNNLHYIYCLSAWCNPGVLAHEIAHVSYSMLSDADKAAFEIAHNAIKDINPLIRLLYSVNSYGLTSTVEAHAEIYRYLGEKMPESLKKYYPMLF